MSEPFPDAAFVAALRALAPRGSALEVWSGEDEPPLRAEEEVLVARAVAKRRADFARGRACAHAALAEVGAPDAPLLAGPSREPLWPDGYVGSITHCGGLAAAVAAARAAFGALGLDAELAQPLPDKVRARVVHPSELEPDQPPLATTVLFSAKESIHKAIHPLDGVWLGFLDVRVRLDLGGGAFTVEAAPDAGATSPHLPGLVGRFVIGDRHVATLCYRGPA